MNNKLLAILTVLFSASVALAENLAPTVKSKDWTDFSGGLNTNTVPWKMNPKYSKSMSNLYIDSSFGRTETVGGYATLGSTNTLDKGKVFFRFVKPDGTQEFIVSNGSNVLSTKDFQTYTTIKTGLAQNFSLDAAQVNDRVWFTNSTQPVFTWDGSSCIVLNGSVQATTLTPNVPMGQYIDYWQNRVWIFNSTVSASRLHFSAILSTDSIPIVLAPDHANAWPLDNFLDFRPGDGEEGLALWVFKNQLHAGKPSHIGTVFGKDESDYFIRELPVSDGPVADRTIAIGDNVTYYLGSRNINTFDGQNVTPISTYIRDDVDSIVKSPSSLRSVLFNSFATFNEGKLGGMYVRDSQTNVRAGLYNTFTPLAIERTVVATATGGVTLDSGYINVTFSSPTPPVGHDLAHIGHVRRVKVFYVADNVPVTLSGTFHLKNNRTGQELQTSISHAMTSFFQQFTVNYSTGLLVTGADIINSSISYRFSNITLNPTNSDYNVFISSIGSGDTSLEVYPSNVQYQTNIASAPTIATAWDQFRASFESVGGGSVTYRYRLGTSIANLVTQSWTDISDGGLINGDSTKRFIQMGASVTIPAPSDITQIASINSLDAKYGEIGAGGNAAGAFYKDRYYIAVQTGTSLTTRRIYAKAINNSAEPNAWMPIDGIHADSLLSTKEVLYAGSSQSGEFWRLDYGDTFDGNAIQPEITLGETDLDNPYFKKKVLKYYLDVNGNSGQNVYVDTYVDTTTVFTSTFTLNSAGRNLMHANNVNRYGNLFSFRIRVVDASQPLRLNRFTVIYEDTKIESFR